jgi:hypothetical protein
MTLSGECRSKGSNSTTFLTYRNSFRFLGKLDCIYCEGIIELGDLNNKVRHSHRGNCRKILWQGVVFRFEAVVKLGLKNGNN